MEGSSIPTRTRLTVVALIATALILPGQALAKGSGSGEGAGALLPVKGEVFAGVSDTGQRADFREYQAATGTHPAVMQSFESWGYVPKEALRRWDATRTRGMLSLSTARCWKCPAQISNASIATGRGDRYILDLAAALNKRERRTYVRLFPEMNGYWNPYSAFQADGDRRIGAYSTREFRRAFRRFAVIVRGGRRAAVNQQLRKLGMPGIQARSKRRLPSPRVAIAWVPQAKGTPDVAGNQPEDYFPGWRYVDWVGADLYGKYPGLAALNSLYRAYDKAPFMIGEWSSWDRDEPAVARSLFAWIGKHKRARMAVYFQGFGEGADNEFEVGDYPRSLEVTRNRLAQRRYQQFAPEHGPRGVATTDVAAAARGTVAVRVRGR